MGNYKLFLNLILFIYRLPPPPSNPCRYGDSFRGGSSPVIAYRAGVGSEPGLADIVPLREVKKTYIVY